MSEKNENKDIVTARVQIQIAITSLNSDPMQTIQQYRDKQASNKRLSYDAVVISLFVNGTYIGKVRCQFKITTIRRGGEPY
jgi:hypothetical protein